jgi:hypothetical protein
MNRTYFPIALLAAAASSAGCASMEGQRDNRLACSVAGDKLYAVSEYGPIGISSRISDQDRQAVCASPAKKQ